MRGLIVDNFAGGGGASTGMAWALGRGVDIAINHDQDAIAMHSANHPETLHYCESVFDVDPVQATAGKPVALAWFSPDCKHFSKAKGTKPVNKEIRGLAWVAIRWAMKVRPRVIMLENVEEFKTWGPLIQCQVTDAMHPCPERKGETFNAFVSMLSTGVDADHPALTECLETLGLLDSAKLIKGLGYKVEFRELRACDYGAPTIRKRLFMVARCDGQPIVWPQPTHGAPDSEAVKSGKLLPWRTAAECIDWSLPCKSIFGRKKPLAENTLRRIAKGIQRFVIDAKEPFIVTCNHGGDGFRGQGLDKPFNTITAAHEAHGIVVPTLAPFITEHANASSQRNMPVNDPLRTICAQVKGGHFAVVQPVLAAANICKHYGGNYTGPGDDLNNPLPTVTTVDHNALITSHMIKLRGTNIGFPMDEPAHTITAGGLHLGEVRAFFIKYYGNEQDGVACNEPLHTITTNDRFGLVMIKGEPYQIIDIGMRMLEPHELFACQGFTHDYIINNYNGKSSKKQQVARVGNSVPPQFAEAITRANLPELCTQTAEAA
ncbi:type II restriction endonuclease subunit M [Shewanella xiamenensis]|uniref:DNA cytosine methyltransferase n=1 Tax=Shewanella xiamenensis TaxID=332186 RepID=UPI001185EAA3|nr:DNA cytosine methyltransferase [Shewanella xiamenensis]TVL22785.1 type II restriction endonuclease subunit M [Shewanella xiamenensis]TVL23064.1 type II restriction endonuclease subunit M [Shewanella xiamenensis]TVL28481.1 type II restriction endonuclease subunit M [Shewanella xiamenensis]TVL36992.1 type II restriction endonuclease subunit M [Shewanella xiamenensis]TVP04642.1 type II restriction endonuclease subunit M [Shewanella xiamenensis]